MPAGEVDTSAIALAILNSGTRLPFRFGSPLVHHCTQSHSPFFRSDGLTPRKESVRSEGGLCTPGGDGRS
jgi:hypothetical protein